MPTGKVKKKCFSVNEEYKKILNRFSGEKVFTKSKKRKEKKNPEIFSQIYIHSFHNYITHDLGHKWN